MWLIHIGRGGHRYMTMTDSEIFTLFQNDVTIFTYLNELNMKITTLCHMLMSFSESYCVQYLQEKSSQLFMENENHPYHSTTQLSFNWVILIAPPGLSLISLILFWFKKQTLHINQILYIFCVKIFVISVYPAI